MKFKVKEGTHHEHGVSYVKGDIVESFHDLTTMFPEKFEKLTEAVPLVSSPASVPLSEPVPEAPTPAPEPPAKPKKAKKAPPVRDSFD